MQRFSTWLKEYIDDTFKCVCVPMCRRKVKANEHHGASVLACSIILREVASLLTHTAVFHFFHHRDFQGHLLQMLMSQTCAFSKMLSRFKTN